VGSRTPNCADAHQFKLGFSLRKASISRQTVFLGWAFYAALVVNTERRPLRVAHRIMVRLLASLLFVSLLLGGLLSHLAIDDVVVQIWIFGGLSNGINVRHLIAERVRSVVVRVIGRGGGDAWDSLFGGDTSGCRSRLLLLLFVLLLLWLWGLILSCGWDSGGLQWGMEDFGCWRR
jgi:hypothetical protein